MTNAITSDSLHPCLMNCKNYFQLFLHTCEMSAVLSIKSMLKMIEMAVLEMEIEDRWREYHGAGFSDPAINACYSISKSKMISRRQGGGDEYCTYVEEADDDANKDSALI